MNSNRKEFNFYKKSIYLISYFCALFLIPFFIKINFSQYIDVYINLWLNITIYFFLFVIALCFFGNTIKKDFYKILNNKKKFYTDLILSVKLEAVALLGQIVMAIIVSRVVPMNTNQELCNQSLYVNFYLTFIVSVFLAPFVEEIVFRFIVFKSIKNKIAAYIITCVSFGFLHCINAVLKGDFIQILLILVYVVPALIGCYIYDRTENIFYNVFIHMIWNIIGNLAHM